MAIHIYSIRLFLLTIIISIILSKHIGLVSQEPVLFATSIRNNIKYGCDGASNEQIEKAARLANAHDFILEFPDGKILSLLLQMSLRSLTSP